MAMTPNGWYQIIIAPLANPPWTTSDYQATPFVVDAIVAATAVTVFCLSDAGVGGAASIAYVGGSCVIPSSAVTIAAVRTTNVTVMDDGETWYSCRSSLGGPWLFYGSSSGLVRSLTTPATLGAFIS